MWLTGKEVTEYIKNGELSIFYKNAQDAFITSGRLTENVPVEDYVMFDVMQEAVNTLY